MKAILVIDMPDNCAECQFCGRGGRNLEKYVCRFTGENSEEPHLAECPLKPIPKHNYYRADTSLVQMANYSTGYADGWNDCLEELEK